jgi:hypothetical protein
MIYLKKCPPYFGKKVFPPIFFMEHLLQGLYGVDAPDVACYFHIKYIKVAKNLLKPRMDRETMINAEQQQYNFKIRGPSLFH